MELYVPDIYKKSVNAIDYDSLKNNGIKCILFDLDNTLIPYKEKEAPQKIVELICKLKEMGFRVILFSNSGKRRVKRFVAPLNIEYYYRAWKPSTKGFYSILKKYNYNECDVAIVGDQIMTDVVGGNSAGITTILINPISKKDAFFTKFNRLREKKVIKKLSKADLFYKGKYYD